MKFYLNTIFALYGRTKKGSNHGRTCIQTATAAAAASMTKTAFVAKALVWKQQCENYFKWISTRCLFKFTRIFIYLKPVSSDCRQTQCRLLKTCARGAVTFNWMKQGTTSISVQVTTIWVYTSIKLWYCDGARHEQQQQQKRTIKRSIEYTCVFRCVFILQMAKVMSFDDRLVVCASTCTQCYR